MQVLHRTPLGDLTGTKGCEYAIAFPSKVQSETEIKWKKCTLDAANKTQHITSIKNVSINK